MELLNVQGLRLLEERTIRGKAARVYLNRGGHLMIMFGCADVTSLVRPYTRCPEELLDWVEQFLREGLI